MVEKSIVLPSLNETSVSGDEKIVVSIVVSVTDVVVKAVVNSVVGPGVSVSVAKRGRGKRKERHIAFFDDFVGLRCQGMSSLSEQDSYY